MGSAASALCSGDGAVTPRVEATATGQPAMTEPPTQLISGAAAVGEEDAVMSPHTEVEAAFAEEDEDVRTRFCLRDKVHVRCPSADSFSASYPNV